MNPWLRQLSTTRNAKIRLFCLPFAGGSASYFHQWKNRLPADISLTAVEYPGRGGRFSDAPLTRCEDAVRELVHAFVTSHTRGRFAFFGHSMGALLAFELSRSLQGIYGLVPEILIVSGARAPDVPRPSSARHHPRIYALPEKQFRDEIRSYAGTPAEVLDNDELMSLRSPALRADFELVQTYEYKPGPKLRAPILAIGGHDDVDDVPVSAIEGWARHTTQAFRAEMMEGDHFFIDKHPSRLSQLLHTVLLPSSAENGAIARN